MHECTRCKSYGLYFRRGYSPDQFIEGKPNSPVWIVGLNPAESENWVDSRTSADLELYFDDPTRVHSYFRDLRSVSLNLYENLGKEHGTAHTDLVKCSSKNFPKGKGAVEIIHNCGPYLQAQIASHKPKMIICNGAPVSQFIKSILPPAGGSHNMLTSYWSEIEGHRVCVVLSGFIGRIDNYSRRRLGIEIESRLREADGV